jgi:hypothetical protein
MAKKESKVCCERCGEVLKPNRIVWLELSQNKGKYYTTLPEGHISQGAFPFGKRCAELETKSSN